MRAICESCDRPQPADWRPGDLCIHCGQAVREEARCFWCAKWCPRGKFCRVCGAASVAPALYGAARMLKRLGASVFEVPNLLATLDPDHIATQQAIYSRHAALAHAHVDEVRFLEQYLYQRHWSSQLEEELIPQLPWDEPRMRALQRRAANGSIDDRVVAAEIAANSPFPLVRDLAQLARLALGDTSCHAAALQIFHAAEGALREEAALHVTDWRGLLLVGIASSDRQALLSALRASRFPALTAPRIAILAGEPIPMEAPASGDADTLLLTAIATSNIPRLETEADSADQTRRFVAARALVRCRRPELARDALAKASREECVQLLHEISRLKTAVPALHETLFALAASRDRSARRAAAEILMRGATHEEAMRLAQIGVNDDDIIHRLLNGKPSPDTYFAIGEWLVHNERMHADRFGWNEAAQPGRMPLGFAEAAFGYASDSTRYELIRFAEMQVDALREFGSATERFLIRCCFADLPVRLLGGAWAAMHRITMHRSVGSTVPCDLSLENVRWCWDMREFLENLDRMLRNLAAQNETFVRDDLQRFLHSADDPFFAAAAALPNQCRPLMALAEADPQPYSYLKQFGNRLAQALNLGS